MTTEIERARRFKERLRLDIRVGMRTLQLSTYREVVNLAKIMELQRENIRHHKESWYQKRGRVRGTQSDRTSSSRKSTDSERGGSAP